MEDKVTLTKEQLNVMIEIAVKTAKNETRFTMEGLIPHIQKKVYQFFNIFQ